MIKNHFPKVNTFWKSEETTGEFEWEEELRLSGKVKGE